MLIAITKRNSIIKALLRVKFLVQFGIIAYGVYIYHQLINGLMHGILLKQVPTVKTGMDIIVTILSIVITTLIAYASFRYFETPFVRFGQQFRYQDEPSIRNPDFAIGLAGKQVE